MATGDAGEEVRRDVGGGGVIEREQIVAVVAVENVVDTAEHGESLVDLIVRREVKNCRLGLS